MKWSSYEFAEEPFLETAAQEDGVEESVGLTPKRKRGRPPKQKPPGIDLENHAWSTMLNVSQPTMIYLSQNENQNQSREFLPLKVEIYIMIKQYPWNVQTGFFIFTIQMNKNQTPARNWTTNLRKKQRRLLLAKKEEGQENIQSRVRLQSDTAEIYQGCCNRFQLGFMKIMNYNLLVIKKTLNFWYLMMYNIYM